jgi:hypothetical protein
MSKARKLISAMSLLAVSAMAEEASDAVTPSLVTPIDLVQQGYVSTYLAVSGDIEIKDADGNVTSRPVTFPVWARKNAIAIPPDRIAELQDLCESLKEQARKEAECAAAAQALRKRWAAFMESISANQWSTPNEP